MSELSPDKQHADALAMAAEYVKRLSIYPHDSLTGFQKDILVLATALCTPSHARRNVPCPLCGVAEGEKCKLADSVDKPNPACPSAASTTPCSGETPRMDAALGKGADWVFAQGCQLERELSVSFRRFDDLQAHYSNELTKLEGASAASARGEIDSDDLAAHNRHAEHCDYCSVINSPDGSTQT